MIIKIIFGKINDVIKHISNLSSSSYSSKAGLSCVEVRIEGRDALFKVNAIVDSKSTCNLITRSLAERLQFPMNNFSSEFQTATGISTVEGKIIVPPVKVHSSDLDGSNVNVGNLMCVENINISGKVLFKPSDLVASHLSDVTIPDVTDFSQIDLLIGSPVPDAFFVIEERRGSLDDIYALRQTLGWNLVGCRKKEAESIFLVDSGDKKGNSTMADGTDKKGVASVEHIFHITNNFSLSNEIFETPFSVLSRYEEHDPCFCSLKNENLSPSIDDLVANKMVDDSMKLENEKFTVGVPWSKDPKTLPQNRAKVLGQAMRLKARLLKNENLANDMVSSIENNSKKVT